MSFKWLSARRLPRGLTRASITLVGSRIPKTPTSSYPKIISTLAVGSRLFWETAALYFHSITNQGYALIVSNRRIPIQSMTLRLVRSSFLWTNYMRFPSVYWASIVGMSFSRSQINPKRGIRARSSTAHIKQIGSYKRRVRARSRPAHSQVSTNSGWKCIPVEEYFFKNWGIDKLQVVKC